MFVAVYGCAYCLPVDDEDAYNVIPFVTRPTTQLNESSDNISSTLCRLYRELRQLSGVDFFFRSL